MRKYIIAAAALLSFPWFMNAQFVVEYGDNQQTELAGNARFTQASDGGWSVAGIDLSTVSSLSRVKRNGPVELDRQAVVNGESCNEYFGDRYAGDEQKGIADYYFMLTNDNLASVYGQNVPANKGGYMVYLDVFAPLSADHNNPVLPSGTYTLRHEKYTEFTVGTDLSWVCLNTDGTVEGLKSLFIEEGTLTVTSEGDVYDITGNFVTDEGESVSVHYTGYLSFVDCTGIDDEEAAKYLREDTAVEPVVVYDVLYPDLGKDDYDEHVLYLFTTTNLSDDKSHCMEAGVKFQISLLSPKGELAGEYTIGERNGWSLVKYEPGLYYPGFYTGSIATNTFLEKVNDDMSVKTSVITGGTLKITKNDDGTYTIDADMVTGNPYAPLEKFKAECHWTGQIEQEVSTISD